MIRWRQPPQANGCGFGRHSIQDRPRNRVAVPSCESTAERIPSPLTTSCSHATETFKTGTWVGNSPRVRGPGTCLDDQKVIRSGRPLQNIIEIGLNEQGVTAGGCRSVVGGRGSILSQRAIQYL